MVSCEVWKIGSFCSFFASEQDDLGRQCEDETAWRTMMANMMTQNIMKTIIPDSREETVSLEKRRDTSPIAKQRRKQDSFGPASVDKGTITEKEKLSKLLIE